MDVLNAAMTYYAGRTLHCFYDKLEEIKFHHHRNITTLSNYAGRVRKFGSGVANDFKFRPHRTKDINYILSLTLDIYAFLTQTAEDLCLFVPYLVAIASLFPIIRDFCHLRILDLSLLLAACPILLIKVSSLVLLAGAWITYYALQLTMSIIEFLLASYDWLEQWVLKDGTAAVLDTFSDATYITILTSIALAIIQNFGKAYGRMVGKAPRQLLEPFLDDFMFAFITHPWVWCFAELSMVFSHYLGSIALRLRELWGLCCPKNHEVSVTEGAPNATATEHPGPSQKKTATESKSYQAFVEDLDEPDQAKEMEQKDDQSKKAAGMEEVFDDTANDARNISPTSADSSGEAGNENGSTLPPSPEAVPGDSSEKPPSDSNVHTVAEAQDDEQASLENDVPGAKKRKPRTRRRGKGQKEELTF